MGDDDAIPYPTGVFTEINVMIDGSRGEAIDALAALLAIIGRDQYMRDRPLRSVSLKVELWHSDGSDP